MKKIILILASAAVIAGCSRARQIKAAGLQTDTFLTAYCSGDYDAAAALCTEQLREAVLKTAEFTGGMDTLVSSEAANILKDIIWDRKVVETEKGTDEVIFTCSTTYDDQILSYTVTLTPVGKDWLISNID